MQTDRERSSQVRFLLRLRNRIGFPYTGVSDLENKIRVLAQDYSTPCNVDTVAFRRVDAARRMVYCIEYGEEGSKSSALRCLP